ncbi:DUF5343 domain-containing protein [Nocardioides rotundus]|uniref:DUF5343 domain-containing protein n=1 Tax=Nocardioides rotundus TaxID=1774216 RepID=UPI001CC1B460|nr:DUF5343 domain-containing protein [Nocardioides rotundus]UAL29113.1 DUF5343 domain-containing protein [Nocardioides rotundus]
MTSEETEEVVETTTDSSTGAARITAAPYMPGKTFTNMFEKYATDGLPDVFDISFFGNISGSTIAQIRSTMRYFDLIDDQYVPTDLMKELVGTDEETRKGLLKMMVEEKYPDALGLSQNATSGQLAKVFNERGLTGATVDKAISFYLHMLDYLSIPYSSHFKKRRPSSNGGARRRAAKKAAEPTPPPVHTPVKPKVSTEEEQKAAYVQTLLDLAKKDGADADLQDRIFDRIEKALGIGGGPAAPTTTGGGTTDSP